MKTKLGKLFQNTQTNTIQAFPYDLQQDYYALIRDAQSKGMRQNIITSDIMMNLAEKLLTRDSLIITAIDFFVEDADLQKEIGCLINKLKRNSAYWAVLKEKLVFINKNDSIDIKQISFLGENTSLSIYVNGVFSCSSLSYDIFSKKIVDIVEGCLC